MDPKDGSAVVLGYTDRIGSDAYNQQLSEKRAQSVVDYLVSKGIPASKISARGMGESNPVTGNTCDNVKARAALIDCLAPDRRVEIEVKGYKDVVTLSRRQSYLVNKNPAMRVLPKFRYQKSNAPIYPDACIATLT